MRRDDTVLPGVIEAEENFLIDCQFLVQDLINRNGISRTELAKRAGISKARLSQIMSAEANPSVKTFARLFHALGAAVAPQVTDQTVDCPLDLQLDVDGWEFVEQAPDLAKPRRTNSDRWLGASNDNYALVAGDLQSFAA